MLNVIRKYCEKKSLKKLNINVNTPRKLGVTKTKRKQQIIISLTSFPARINSTYKTVLSLLNQDFLPDRIILWLAKEQFENIGDLPESLLKLEKYGLEIKWYHDVKAYKKLIPTLLEFPDALVVTVDDDWYYAKNMLEILVKEHNKYPEQIICHAVTHPELDENNMLRTTKENIDYRGTASYFNKILGGSGVLFPPNSLDTEIFNEEIFMNVAPTNDDIWFWGMAVKKGTKIRLASEAQYLTVMTDSDIQNATSLSSLNSEGNIYEVVTNKMLELYPEILYNLKKEVNKYIIL